MAGNAPVSSYPPAMPITVRLRQSRASVQGVLRLYNASVQVKLVVLPIGVESSVSSTRAQWMPYARARIRAWTYLDFPAFDHTLIRDWKPEGAPDRTVVVHAAPGTPPDGLPTVTPIGVDDLIFENTNGVQFIPPRYVEWRGWLGEFSSPKTSHVFDGVSDTDQQSNLLRVALSTATNAQNGLRIPGWSDQHEGSLTHPVNTYGGYLQIGWSQ